jgi:hypothetical protein
MEKSIDEASMPEEVKAILTKGGMPEGSIILRNWYRTLPADNRWTPNGAIRSEAIVMLDLASEKVRFKWSTESDFESGEMHQELIVWKGPERFQVVTVRRENAWNGLDWADSLEEGRKARGRGHLPEDEETLVTIALGGREWTTTDHDWMHGTLLPEDQAALDALRSEELLDVLEMIEAVAQMEPNLLALCTTITHPLLGRFDDPCKLHAGAINLMQDPPDCRFDARFGETCSPAQLMASERDRQPNLAQATEGGG